MKDIVGQLVYSGDKRWGKENEMMDAAFAMEDYGKTRSSFGI